MRGEQKGDFLVGKARETLNEMHISDALALFDASEAAGHEPDICAAGRWTCHMLAGDFEQAWRESDGIERRGQPDPHRFWDRTPIAGKKVILRCLHGLGDTIQFIRFAPKIRECAASFTVEAQPALRSLLMRADIADRVITWGDAAPEWDQQIEVNELPRLFRVTEETLSSVTPYLSIPRSPSVHFRGDALSLKVGLVWSASIYNPLRSIPLSQLAPLFEIPECSFFSFQAGPACEELQSWAGFIANLSEHAADVLETAENMLGMDLVITVDTMTAHLAGALGLPTWTLLPFACDWRWMVNRSDSPWYPTMRLIRQEQAGKWESVVHRLASALQLLCQQKAQSQGNQQAVL